MPINERETVRELARKYVELCADPAQPEKRRLWRRLNSLQDVRPLIHVRAFAWQEMPEARLTAQDPVLRALEEFFRNMLFRGTLGDDSVFEPWVDVQVVHRCTGWGVAGERHWSGEPRGSFKIDYPLRNPEDLAKLRVPRHEIDETRTRERAGRARDAVGDILPVNVDRTPAYWMWTGDLATELGYLRGIEHFMLDMLDRPEWLHALAKFLSDGILKVHDEAEAAGDWGLHAHKNQSMPYVEDLPDPAPNTRGVARSRLWCFMAAQEFTAVSPAMHEEFLLRYQLPIFAKFGLVAYGCCEDLTRKIDMLRAIPNLRRIAVSPFADVARCAEQIGRDYVLSYRPSPSDMVGYGFDPARIRCILDRDLAACRGCCTDIVLKDVETVEGDPARVRNWVALAREAIARIT